MYSPNPLFSVQCSSYLATDSHYSRAYRLSAYLLLFLLLPSVPVFYDVLESLINPDPDILMPLIA